MNLPYYLKYKDSTLFFNDINLLDLIKKEGDCLEICAPFLIRKQINSLIDIFDKKIKSNNYNGKYEYFYATKANYQKYIINEVLKWTNYLETSSRNDISIIEYLYKNKLLNEKSKVICNGFKDEEYFSKIIKLKKTGLYIVPIIENIEELNYLINLDMDLEIGIRINVDKEYNKVYKINDCSRFGIYYEDLLDNINLLKNSKLRLTTFHFHMNHNIKDINNYIKILNSIIKNRYIPLKKMIPSLNYLDIGGGIPVSYYNDFNYELLIDKMIKTIKNNCIKYNVDVPNIISESGSYTVADTRFMIYKIQLKKMIKNNSYWYILNNSIVNTIPDSWITYKSYLVLPINLINNRYVNVRLSSLTCDNADKYFFQERKEYLKLPDYDNEDLYIGFFKTGSYEEILSGFNTIHHCLIEEPKKLLIDEDNKISIISEKQTSKDILELLKY